MKSNAADEMEENNGELYKHMEEGCLQVFKIKDSRNPRDINSSLKCCRCHIILAASIENDTYVVLNNPIVCTNITKEGSIFCEEHYKLWERHQISTKEDFLKKGRMCR